MMNTCHQCGTYRADKLIDPTGPYAVCPVCRYKHRFRQMPLLAIGGASGTGKTTIGRLLLGQIPEVIIMEGDLLWRADYDTPGDKYRQFYEAWLRLAKNISQSGNVVALLNAGAAVPANLEECVERRYFSSIRYCALVCEEEGLQRRLRRRFSEPAASDQAFIERNVEYNRRLIDRGAGASSSFTLIDTTDVAEADAAERVREWILRNRG